MTLLMRLYVWYLMSVFPMHVASARLGWCGR